MLELLEQSPLLLLFVVAAFGYLLGKVRVQGFSLGVAAVLFVGLGAGALDPELSLPEIVQTFGLVLFVYGIGLASGPGFFASFRRRGLRDNGLALGVLAMAAVASAAVGMLLGLPGSSVAGLYAGALTNTPALASVLDELGVHRPTGLADPVVAYAICYPAGVLGVLVALWAARRDLRAKEGPIGQRDATVRSRTSPRASIAPV